MNYEITKALGIIFIAAPALLFWGRMMFVQEKKDGEPCESWILAVVAGCVGAYGFYSLAEAWEPFVVFGLPAFGVYCALGVIFFLSGLNALGEALQAIGKAFNE